MKRLHSLIAVVLIFWLSACNGHEEDTNCISGTVLHQISCTGLPGLAFAIKMETKHWADTIMTTTLPDQFQVEGMKIFFEIRNPDASAICTTDIVPPAQYDVFNVGANSCLTADQ